MISKIINKINKYVINDEKYQNKSKNRKYNYK